ncbi:MAG: DNA-binding protein [Promethearchaeota archaeon]
MSDEELNKIRQQRQEELRNQIARQQNGQEISQREEQYNQQKNLILRRILSSDARVRLENLRLARKNFADSIESQLIRLFQTGTLQKSVNLPISDQDFKEMLANAQKGKKRNTKIKII